MTSQILFTCDQAKLIYGGGGGVATSNMFVGRHKGTYSMISKLQRSNQRSELISKVIHCMASEATNMSKVCQNSSVSMLPLVCRAIAL